MKNCLSSDELQDDILNQRINAQKNYNVNYLTHLKKKFII